jgi:hypothetical protein
MALSSLCSLTSIYSVAFVSGCSFPYIEKHYRVTHNGLWLRSKELFQCVLIILVIILCSASILFQTNSSDPQYLLSFTPLHSFILFVVSFIYVVELGLFVAAPHLKISLTHHILGTMGLCYLISREILGALMVRLLLDAATDLFFALENWLNVSCRQYLYRAGDKLTFFSFLSIRIIYYPCVLCSGIYQFWQYLSRKNDEENFILFFMLLLWFLFSMIYHVQGLKQHYNYYTLTVWRNPLYTNKKLNLQKQK